MDALLLLLSARLILTPQDSFIDEIKSFEEERDGDMLDSFDLDNLPGAQYRNGNDAKVIEENRKFFNAHKDKIERLKGFIGTPVDKRLYNSHRFIDFPTW